MNKKLFKTARWIGLLIVIISGLISIIATGGGGDGNGGSGSNFTLDISISLGSTYYSVGQSTLSFDGAIVATNTNPSGSAFVGLDATVRSVKSGQHTIAIKIIKQTAYHQEYLAGGIIIDTDSVESILLETKTATLRTGESIVYQFNTKDLQ
jgi:hypothetical protein